MGAVECLVAEHPVNGEVLAGSEGQSLLEGGLLRLSQLVEHARRDSRGVSAQDVLARLALVPVALVASRPCVTSILVDIFDALDVVILGKRAADSGVTYVEGIVEIAGGVLLGLEQGIEVPERGLHPTVGRHFFKPHL